MEPNIRWLDQPDVFRVNQLPAHSNHEYYKSEIEYMRRKNNSIQSLNGVWKFSYSINAKNRPVDFYKPDANLSEFVDILVPQHIEMAGFDKIHYINTKYPWDGQVYRRPAYFQEDYIGKGMFSEADYNPVGSYVYLFDLKEELVGNQIHISFEGVEQAMYVWLNGLFIGYAEDSFTMSEFELTPYLKEKNNYLAVEVHKRSTAAFLEDQDFFRFFGIFRDVKLYGFPETHVWDLCLKPLYEPETGKGSLSVYIENIGEIKSGRIQLLLQQDSVICWKEERELSEKIILENIMFSRIIPWCHENPYLYNFIIKIYNVNDDLIEIVPYEIGFLKLELKNKIMYLNGKRLIINGVNRHEWSAEYGRCITEKEEISDMNCLLKNHINAVRTSHYPNRVSWYKLCDKKGIYMMAETNLETHGSWQKNGVIEPSWNLPGNLRKWEGAVLDRAKTNYETFKNHVSILFWSLGNESYAGDVLAKMNAFYKKNDTHRFVHYEGVFWNAEYKDRISDIESRMYSTPESIDTYLRNNPEKPFVLCEYMHNMGNSLGGLNSYMELIDKYDMYQGGFIWDLIDQALFVKDEVTGEKVLRYGGDFDDRPSDYEFSGNGLLFADRTEKPAIQDVRFFYEKYKF